MGGVGNKNGGPKIKQLFENRSLDAWGAVRNLLSLAFEQMHHGCFLNE